MHIEDYDTTAANNTDDFPENMNPSAVNDAGRTTQADIAQFRKDLRGECTVGGTVDAITLTYSPTHTALQDKRFLIFRAAGANTSTTPTLQEDSLTAKTIVKNGNQALVAGDIYGAGHQCIVQYNSTNDNYELLNPAINLASNAEVQAGTDASKIITPSTLRGGMLVSGTVTATTSGTSHDYTSIPSWVKRITILFSGVSLSGTASPLVQIGDSGGIETTGYTSTAATTSSNTSSTSGFVIRSATDTNTNSGRMVIENIDGDEWVSTHIIKVNTNTCSFGGGDKTLSGTLDRVRITTTNGTDTFDAGSVNIIYE